MTMFRGRIFQQASKYSNTLLRCLNVSSYTSKWLMPIHEIFFEYGTQAAQNYIQLVTDEHLQSYMTRKFKDIAIQSWHSKLSNSKLTHRYAFCKNEFKLEQCLNRLLPATQIKLARFRCALYALPTVPILQVCLHPR